MHQNILNESNILCKCKSCPSALEICNDYSKFISTLRELEWNNWKSLMKCSVCGQLWRVDSWEKYHATFAVKIMESTGWRELSCKELIKPIMLEVCAGYSDETCGFENCLELKLKLSKFCLEHSVLDH